MADESEWSTFEDSASSVGFTEDEDDFEVVARKGGRNAATRRCDSLTASSDEIIDDTAGRDDAETIYVDDDDDDARTEDGMFDMFTHQVRTGGGTDIGDIVRREVEQEIVERRRNDNTLSWPAEVQQDRQAGATTTTVADDSSERSIPFRLRSDCVGDADQAEDSGSIGTYPLPLYRPLAPHKIRVVNLLPATSSDEPLRCEMTIQPETTEYLALSLAWSPHNDGELVRSLICNGHEIAVTAHLHAALQALRSHLDSDRLPFFGRRLPVWVKSICVDQDDNEERARQLASIARISKKSVSTLVWLGDASAEHKEDKVLLEMVRMCPMAIFNQQHWEPTTSQLAILKSVLRRGWFTCRFVIQEFSKGSKRQVMLGKCLIELDRFMVLVEHLGLLPQAGPMAYVRLFDGLRPHRYLLANLHRYSAWECASPYDLLFTLRNISCGCGDSKSICSQSKCVDSFFDFDYTEPIEGIFLRLASRFVKNDPVAVLVSAGCRRSSPDDDPTFSASESHLPSWVPDWRIRPQYSSREYQTLVDDCFSEIAHARMGSDWSFGGLPHESVIHFKVTNAPFPLLSLNCWLFGPQAVLSSVEDTLFDTDKRDTLVQLEYFHGVPMSEALMDGREQDYKVREHKNFFSPHPKHQPKPKQHFRGAWPRLKNDELVCLLPHARIGLVLRNKGCHLGPFQLEYCFRRPMLHWGEFELALVREEDETTWLEGMLNVASCKRIEIC